MTPSERQWLQDARRFVRIAIVKAEIGDWDAAVVAMGNVADRPSLGTPDTIEVGNMLASFANTKPSDLRSNAAMRAAAIRRLEETKVFIGDALTATTGH